MQDKLEELKEFFRYDIEKNTLERKWKKDGEWRVVNSSVANHSNGYIQVSYIYRLIYVHRLIYILVNGNIPEGMTISHIDNDKYNNRISNLQLLSHRENAAKNRGGLKPHFHKLNQSYQVRENVRFGEKKHTFHFGYFKIKSDAKELCEAYNSQFGYGKPQYSARTRTPEHWKACMVNFKNFYFNDKACFWGDKCKTKNKLLIKREKQDETREFRRINKQASLSG